MIWNIVNILRSGYKAHEYEKVILSMTIIKRFHDVLRSTCDVVIETSRKTEKFANEMCQKMLNKAFGYDFNNISSFTFETLLSNPTYIEENFRSYLNKFSDNVQDVLSNFEFDKEISKLVSENMLFYMIKGFNKSSSYFGSKAVISTDMGYIFEELIRKFFESYEADGGEYFTSRDIIYSMTNLLLVDKKEVLQDDSITTTIYDQTMGTGQMLGAMTERIHHLNYHL
ncbi:Type I restriction-modification system, DNA-methyltransferase subunit M [Catellicoccus marimammalium M35/04/3]|uniref:site-specific DNA-methyltransferase (adenine-specific) n=2 Tax=Catellicoccus TaxID=300418 RepID=K8ZNZ4_9ENTE|nr:Type I restriction-modification system, DNA-methyltransferase subunit M [Catellicoccus marimammalium M35/04/3]